MGFNQKHNSDDIHIRAVISGLVDLLNSKIFFNNVLSNTQTDQVHVPFYFSFTGDERYLQDKFLDWSSCRSSTFADGNYEKVPRGIVKLTSKRIKESELTQRFIRGTYTKEINGNLETFSANLNPIPLEIGFDVEIVANSMTDLSKIDQQLLETFYKVQMFNVNFKGFLISCMVEFPDETTNEKIFEYSFPDDENNFILSFSLTLSTYYPVVDDPGVFPENKKFFIDNIEDMNYYTKDLSEDENGKSNDTLSTERHITNRMEHVVINKESVNQNNEKTSLFFVSINDNTNFNLISSISIPILFKWKYNLFKK
jgi:hypothetical protein